MTTNDTTRTEADAIAEAARRGAEPRVLAPGQMHAIPTATGVQLVDLDKDEYRTTPRRKAGTTYVEDIDSFKEAWGKHSDDGSELYVNVERHFITAVLNADTADGPRWADHRLVLKLKTTDRWNAWTGLDRKPLTQVQWAEFIEDHLDDIRSPAAAEMLEIAQTFQANSKVKFKSAVALGTGQRTLNWEETIEAKAGEAGQKTVPGSFTIGIAPFDFADAYEVTARFRYRIQNGSLTVLFLLDDPAAVIRDAVLDVVAKIEESTKRTVMRGTPA